MKANEIISGLWLGDMNAATDSSFFKKYNIKAVINCTPDVPMLFRNVDYLNLVLDDSLKEIDILKMTYYLPKAVEFIHLKKDIEGKNILIHCHAGMQRSAAVVAAYLYKYHGLSLTDARKLIELRRPVAFHHGRHVNFIDALNHYTNQKSSNRRAPKRIVIKKTPLKGGVTIY